MSFKDEMIQAVESGHAACDQAYDYVRESRADAADRARDRADEGPIRSTIPLFTVGDRVILDDGEWGEFSGVVTSAAPFNPQVMVKLDVGGTFRVRRIDLRRI